MKIRTDFVTNSSSSSFIITNKTDSDKTILQFVLENTHLVDLFNEEYGDSQYMDDYTLGEVLKSSSDDYDQILEPGDNEVVFGDEQGTVLGRIFDYILRDGGESMQFKWVFHEALR